VFSGIFLSEIVDGECREFGDATTFGVQTYFEALLNMSQRSACSLVKAKR